MTDPRTAAIQYAHENSSRFLDELMEFASIPSISTDEASKGDVVHAAEWVASHLRSIRYEKCTANANPRSSGCLWRLVRRGR